MKGRIDFKYLQADDVILAEPHWNIETEEDLETWYQQYVTYMKKFGRKMDFIVVLDDFNIAPAVGSKWGEYRAKIHKEYIRYNYRVHANNRVQLYTTTSSIRYDISREDAASVEDALDGVRASRRAAELKAKAR
jgi:hypothetical protein